MASCGAEEQGYIGYGSAAEKLRMFERARASGGFANEHPADLAKAEKMLREFVAMEKDGG